MDKKRIIIGASGASGLPILKKCLELIQADERYESVLVMSESAKLTLSLETDDSVEDIEALADIVLSETDIAAGPASGTFRTEGMLIVPCSMKTLAGIHAGYAENLLLRAADVTLKEQRRLILAVRETPLNPIHLRNMQELSMNVLDVAENSVAAGATLIAITLSIDTAAKRMTLSPRKRTLGRS